MVFVRKFDGRRERFKKTKVVNTCLRLGALPKEAKKIADQIEKEAYEGIPTKKILDKIFKYLSEYIPRIKEQIDLRDAISLLRPKPDFELFIGKLLQKYGYRVRMNQIVPGRCVEQEVDAIARRGDDVVYVEIKHHVHPHTYTGVGIFLEVWARFQDLLEGFKLGKHRYNFNRALVICNTKISDHARRYAECRGIEHIGWKAPKERGLERLIEEKKLYPITFLKGMDRKSQEKFADSGIILLRELVRLDLKELRARTKIKKERLEKFVEGAKKILKG